MGARYKRHGPSTRLEKRKDPRGNVRCSGRVECSAASDSGSDRGGSESGSQQSSHFVCEMMLSHLVWKGHEWAESARRTPRPSLTSIGVRPTVKSDQHRSAITARRRPSSAPPARRTQRYGWVQSGCTVPTREEFQFLCPSSGGLQGFDASDMHDANPARRPGWRHWRLVPVLS